MVASVVAIVRRTQWTTGFLIRDLSVVRERRGQKDQLRRSRWRLEAGERATSVKIWLSYSWFILGRSRENSKENRLRGKESCKSFAGEVWKCEGIVCWSIRGRGQ